MKIDVVARTFGTPAGGPNGMAIAAGYLVYTLWRLGHQVRHMVGPDGFKSDLVITTVQPSWRRLAAAAIAAGVPDRLCYWHHAGGVPQGHGCILAAPPAIGPQDGWARQVVLPPSSWAAEAGGECTGEEVLVAGAGPPKGGHVALEVARLCPDLRWLVLNSRSSAEDRDAWWSIPHAHVANKPLEPKRLLERARVVLSPTRFEVHPLLLVEAAVRGIPIVCTDLPSTRCAAGDSAIYVPMHAPAAEWAAALRQALERPLPRLQLPPYEEVVRGAVGALLGWRAAA